MVHAGCHADQIQKLFGSLRAFFLRNSCIHHRKLDILARIGSGNEVEVLENMSANGMTKWIRISMNPSSWFADLFVDFYNETYEKNYHFQLTTAGVRSVMERVRDYILSQQKENFLHELAKNKLQFVSLHETDVILYPGRQTELYDLEKETVNLGELEGVRFIQNYQDEFFDIGSVNEEAFQWKDLDISVLTNSDYIMERMLKNS